MALKVFYYCHIHETLEKKIPAVLFHEAFVKDICFRLQLCFGLKAALTVPPPSYHSVAILC